MKDEYVSFIAEQGPHFRNVVHIKNVLDGTRELEHSLKVALRTAIASGSPHVRLRAFNSHTLDYKLANRIFSSPPMGSDNIVNWLNEQGGKCAGIAINSLATWSLALGEWYAGRVSELLTNCGYRVTQSLDTYAFICAGSGWTPFGIHTDYEPSLIYHLGPGTKTAWVWPSGKPACVATASNPGLSGISFDIESQLPAATPYALEAGDFLCLPANHFHIFENHGPSSFLGLTVYPTDFQRLCEKVLAQEAAIRIKLTRVNHKSSLIEAATEFSDQLATHLPNFRYRIADHYHQLKSTGFTSTPHRSAIAALPVWNHTSRVSPRFDGVFQPCEDQTQIFCLGRPIKHGLGKRGDQLCAEFNSIDQANAQHIAEKFNYPNEAVELFLSRCSALGGFKL